MCLNRNSQCVLWKIGHTQMSKVNFVSNVKKAGFNIYGHDWNRGLGLYLDKWILFLPIWIIAFIFSILLTIIQAFRCPCKEDIISRRTQSLPGRWLAGIFPCEVELEQLHPASADRRFDHNSILRGRFYFGRAWLSGISADGFRQAIRTDVTGGIGRIILPMPLSLCHRQK